jgi:hypothetical protein
MCACGTILSQGAHLVRPNDKPTAQARKRVDLSSKRASKTVKPRAHTYGAKEGARGKLRAQK